MGIAVGINLLWLGDRAAGVGRYAAELLPALLEEAPGTRIVAFAGRGLPSDLAAAPWAAEVEWVRLPVKLSGAPRLAAELLALPALALARRLDVLHSPAAVGPAVVPTVAVAVTVSAPVNAPV